MRKILLALSLCTILLTSCTEDLYPRTMTVTAIDSATDTVVLTDYVGYIWEFYGIENWEIGDVCACIMDTNGTENITDDIIIQTQYNGGN